MDRILWVRTSLIQARPRIAFQQRAAPTGNAARRPSPSVFIGVYRWWFRPGLAGLLRARLTAGSFDLGLGLGQVMSKSAPGQEFAENPLAQHASGIDVTRKVLPNDDPVPPNLLAGNQN